VILYINARRRNFTARARTHASGRRVVLAKPPVCIAVIAVLVARKKVLARIR